MDWFAHFFSREAPFAPQVVAMLVFATATFAGVYVGLGRIIESRSGGVAYLGAGIGAYAFFLWWSHLGSVA